MFGGGEYGVWKLSLGGKIVKTRTTTTVVARICHNADFDAKDGGSIFIEGLTYGRTFSSCYYTCLLRTCQISRLPPRMCQAGTEISTTSSA